MSMFDPQAFLDSEQSTGFDSRNIIPNAGEYVGYVGMGEKDIEMKQFPRKDGNGDTTIASFWLYTDDTRAAPEGLQLPARCRFDCFVDFLPGGGLDFGPGKNKQLGRLLFALGYQDKDGKNAKPWSFRKLGGGRLKFVIGHGISEKTGEPYAEVKAVAPA